MQQDLRPWLINDDAWTQMVNCYVFRGRVRKRFGSYLMSLIPNYSRLGIQVGTIGAPAAVPGLVFKIGQQFQAGTQIFTVYQLGAPAAMLATGPGTGTFNTTTGAFVLAGTGLGAGTPIYFYSSTPVMGIDIWEQGTFNNQQSFAFDTQFAYTWNGTQWLRSITGTAPQWHGTNLNFFSVANWTGLTDSVPVMFVANNYVLHPNGAGDATDDPLWTWNAPAALGWTPFVPYFAPAGGAPHTGPFVVNCKIIMAWQNRLLLLNTIENDGTGGGGVNTTYSNRVRYCWYGSPFSQNAWYESLQFDNGGTDVNVNLAGGGNAVDCTTDEQIISAEFIKDRLIIFFERSTWELVYTGNEIIPFRFQKINTELGSESTFGTIPHDRYILTVGETGVHSCNGQNVTRIDDKIPDVVFEITQKNSGMSRIYGIRDYFVEMDYWAFPSDASAPAYSVYPNYVLVYNYKNGSWSVNNDCITAFGYFDQYPAQTWQQIHTSWEMNGQTWDADQDVQNERQVLAGNPQGFMFLIDANESSNALNMQITNIATVGANTVVTILDHSFIEPDWIIIEQAQGVVGINDTIYGVFPLTANTAAIFIVVLENDIIVYQPAPFTGAYTGGGIAARVSLIFAQSKQWNPYAKDGRNVFVEKIDFCVLKTSSGQVTIDYFASSSNLGMLGEGNPITGTGALMGTGILETTPYNPIYYPLEATQERLWHPLYLQSDGQFIQIQINQNPLQITNPAIAFSDFELEALTLYCQPTTSRMS